MVVSNHKIVGKIIFAATVIFISAAPALAAPVNAISKDKCVGCGCKYERDCDGGGCTISCSCQEGPQNDCMSKAAISGVSVSRLPSKITNYHLREALPAAKQPAAPATKQQ
jgi:hypothetical protein